MHSSEYHIAPFILHVEKMNKRLLLLFFVMSSFLTGCSSQYPVTFNSTPQSAMVVCNGLQKGYTPLTLYYQRTGIDSSGDLHTEACKAVWASGAEAIFAVHFDTNKYPDGVMETLQRPNAEGYSTDASMDYQKKVSDMQIQQQQQESLNNSIQQMKNSLPKQTYCNQIGTQTLCQTY